MQLEVVSARIAELDCDLVAVALAEGAALVAPLADAPGAEDARGEPRRLALIHPGRPPRALAVGVGAAGEIDPERLRVAGALAAKRAGELEARSLAWVVPEGPEAPARAAALLEGVVLASYRFDRFRSEPAREPATVAIERLVLVADPGERDAVEAEARVALAGAEATNRARALQDTPANELTPEALAARAREIGVAGAVELEVLDREAIERLGMGGLAAVARGSAAEPRLIALRYAGGGAGPRIGLVGKAVTFDSGGISIKPAAAMHEMKMDMSGGAAVLEAFAAVVELGLELDLVAVVPATENMPDAAAVKPGDVIRQLDGRTVEVNNTDAEGRLILADALTYCVRELGAERVVDLATLTGAVIVALGSTYAALISNDERWAETVREAGEACGELAWPLPLHEEYRQMVRGKVADLTNLTEKRKAGTITAAAFLEGFADGVPWAHLDIAGTAWDTGREYLGAGASGFGARLLLRLARELAAAQAS